MKLIDKVTCSRCGRSNKINPSPPPRKGVVVKCWDCYTQAKAESRKRAAAKHGAARVGV